MTTNYQRAIEILNKHWGVAKETGMADEAECCVKALAKANLLAPELAEPRVFENGEKEWLHPDGWIDIENGAVTIAYNECDDEERPQHLPPEPDTIYSTNPIHLRWLALDILAAANHLEQEQP